MLELLIKDRIEKVVRNDINKIEETDTCRTQKEDIAEA